MFLHKLQEDLEDPNTNVKVTDSLSSPSRQCSEATYMSPIVLRVLSQGGSGSSLKSIKSSRQKASPSISRRLKFDEEEPHIPIKQESIPKPPLQKISYLSTVKNVVLGLAILLALGLVIFASRELNTYFSQLIEDRALSNVKTRTLTMLQEQKGNFECGYVNDGSLPRNLVEQALEGQNYSILGNEVLFDGSTFEYIGNETIRPLKCELYFFARDFLIENQMGLILALLISSTLFYLYYKITSYRMNSRIVKEMTTEVINILEEAAQNENHRHEGYVAQEHVKTKVASTRPRIRLWNQVVSKIDNDQRVLTTPRKISGEQMVTWRWISTVS